MLKNKKILLCIIIFILVVITCISIVLLKDKKKSNQLENIEKSIENILFYLPDSKYDNMNNIPDYCKLNLVYGTDYLKSDLYISSDDYDTIVDGKTNNSISAYSNNALLSAIKNVLGDDATINFESNDDGDYEFIEENGCGNNNKKIGSISYNSEKEFIYSKESKEIQKLYVKWDDPVVDGDYVNLTAYALLPLINEDGSYTVYANSSQTYVAGNISSGKDIDKEISDMYDRSLKYNIKLKKNGNKYTWVNYEVVDDVYTVKADNRTTTKHQVGGN